MDEYDQLIAELANHEPLDPALLPDLLLSLYDDTDGEEVMWGLLHLVEDFPAEAYAVALVEALPRMVIHAKEWALLLLQRMVNSESDRLLLRDAYRAAGPEKQRLPRDLLAEIVAKNAVFAARVEQITAPF